MRGLDPPTHYFREIYAEWMDPRVKHAGDVWARGNSIDRETAAERSVLRPSSAVWEIVELSKDETMTN